MNKTTTHKHLNVVTWNCNSLQLKHLEFKTFLEDNNIDVALLTETRLSPRQRPFIPGYTLIKRDQPINPLTPPTTTHLPSAQSEILHPPSNT